MPDQTRIPGLSHRLQGSKRKCYENGLSERKSLAGLNIARLWFLRTGDTRFDDVWEKSAAEAD